MVNKKAILDSEDGLRVKAEIYFQERRKRLVCPSCKVQGSFELSSAGLKRRFQCACHKSWSVTTFLREFDPTDSLMISKASESVVHVAPIVVQDVGGKRRRCKSPLLPAASSDSSYE